jgi:pSer/pThr/pTyr-binding forkhead associated (FHA) protein
VRAAASDSVGTAVSSSSSSPLNPHPASPVEMQERILAEREGNPFLLLRDGDRTQRLVRLPTDGDRLTIGRGEGVDLALDWDDRVSRVHAELERVGDSWAVADDGLSRNGTYVNGKRVRGRQRLEEGDELRLGGTRMVFRAPEGGVGGAATTKVSQSVAAFTAVSDAQRRVLIALCRPFAGGDPWARPATNKDIAAELFLSVPAVKTHLRALFGRFGIEDLGQNEKRLRLAELAFQAGLVSMEDVQGQSDHPLGS